MTNKSLISNVVPLADKLEGTISTDRSNNSENLTTNSKKQVLLHPTKFAKGQPTPLLTKLFKVVKKVRQQQCQQYPQQQQQQQQKHKQWKHKKILKNTLINQCSKTESAIKNHVPLQNQEQRTSSSLFEEMFFQDSGFDSLWQMQKEMDPFVATAGGRTTWLCASRNKSN
ncbi:unnamed protein product [Rotaria magnacalcarata]|uniref:Uncharacterized protein n=1 Tax=Rotaria magnacalcarata TaxID=392030 RepID=A0A819QF66_9BILA|nr:unnamed protein product [Rotaria magnacalcarata]CAF4023389.1 unnamed protein product [Rotaria magnacalcarata]